MKLGIITLLFFGEVFLIGGMFYLFQEIMGWIAPTFVIEHAAAYALAGLIWSALPAIALLGLIVKYSRKDQPPTYTGGYF